MFWLRFDSRLETRKSRSMYVDIWDWAIKTKPLCLMLVTRKETTVEALNYQKKKIIWLSIS